jgi:hypothetical protein
MTVLPSLMCAICGKSIAPESCQLDQHDAPVHKSCYAKKILMGEHSSSATQHRKALPGDRREGN